MNLFIVNFEHISHSSVSIVDIEQVNVGSEQWKSSNFPEFSGSQTL